MSLSNIRLVLIEPSHSGNIGAVARAMKTMGLEQLYLVRPVAYQADVAESRAVGAVHLLHSAVLTDEIGSVVSDCKLVIGVSARSRELSLPVLDAREGGARIAAEAATGDPVAVLFGPERNGLSNQDLDLCTYQIRIPTSPGFKSLNLAAALQLVCYEIFLSTAAESIEKRDPSPYPSQEEMEFFYRHLEQTLEARDFSGSVNPERINAKLRRLVARARPTVQELKMLHSLVRLMRDESD